MSDFRFSVSYWGTISYFKNLCKSENPILEIYETYKKQSIRNRAYLLSSNGVFNLTIPIIKPKGNKTLTKDIIVDFSQNFQIINWKSIKTAYQSSPFFEHYENDIKPIILSNKKYLIDHCFLSLEFIFNTLQIPLHYTFSNDFISSYKFDYLNKFDKRNIEFQSKEYIQVYSDILKFEKDLSILDAILNLGPISRKLIL